MAWRRGVFLNMIIDILIPFFLNICGACSDLHLGMWNDGVYYDFCKKNIILASDSKSERDHKLEKFELAIDSCGMGSWLMGSLFVDKKLKSLPPEVLCNAWGIFNSRIVKNTELWNKCVVRKYKSELLDYARSDARLSKNREILFQLRDTLLMRNIKASFAKTCDTGYLDENDLIEIGANVSIVLKYSDSSTRIKALSAMSLSKRKLKGMRGDYLFCEQYVAELMRTFHDTSESRLLNKMLRRRSGARTSDARKMVNDELIVEISRYAKKKCDFGAKELQNYIKEYAY